MYIFIFFAVRKGERANIQPTGQGDCRKTETFSSSSMSCRKSLRMKPEMLPEIGTLPRCGADWKSSQRTCKPGNTSFSTETRPEWIPNMSDIIIQSRVSMGEKKNRPLKCRLITSNNTVRALISRHCEEWPVPWAAGCLDGRRYTAERRQRWRFPELSSAGWWVLLPAQKMLG